MKSNYGFPTSFVTKYLKNLESYFSAVSGKEVKKEKWKCYVKKYQLRVDKFVGHGMGKSTTEAVF